MGTLEPTFVGTRSVQRYYLDSVVDGDIEYHYDRPEDFEGTIEELATWVKQDGCFFGDGFAWATHPDSSHTVNYATGEEEIVSWYFPGLPEDALNRLIDIVNGESS